MTEPTDKQLPDEQQLDEYLKGDSSVSRQYRQLHSAEVPAELDSLVLRRAEDAVKSRSSQRPAWARWTAPLAVAASAVLALAIVIETGVRDETMVTQPVMQAKQRERAENKAEESFIAEPGAPAAAAPADAMTDAEHELAADKRVTSPQSENVTRAAPPSPPAEEPVAASEAPKVVAQTQPISPPFAPPPGAATDSAQSLVMSAAVAKQELQAAAIEEAAKKQSAGAADETARAAGARDTVETPSAPAAASYSRRISTEIPPLPRLYTDPEAWLKDIRQLRKDNKQEQADREWRRFRAAFPNYEVAENDTAREAKK